MIKWLLNLVKQKMWKMFNKSVVILHQQGQYNQALEIAEQVQRVETRCYISETCLRRLGFLSIS
jgi:hypothetical protein